MKFFLFLTLITSFSAQAIPELYCVSTAGYGAITKISLFTNAKGNLTGGIEVTSQEGYLADINSIVRLRNLSYDEVSGTITNASKTFTIVLDKKELSPAQASKYFLEYVDDEGNVSRVRGHHVGFSKYRLAKLTNFEISAKNGSWQEALNNAFKVGVNKYLCGDVVNMIKN